MPLLVVEQIEPGRDLFWAGVVGRGVHKELNHDLGVTLAALDRSRAIGGAAVSTKRHHPRPLVAQLATGGADFASAQCQCLRGDDATTPRISRLRRDTSNNEEATVALTDLVEAVALIEVEQVSVQVEREGVPAAAEAGDNVIGLQLLGAVVGGCTPCLALGAGSREASEVVLGSLAAHTRTVARAGPVMAEEPSARARRG